MFKFVEDKKSLIEEVLKQVKQHNPTFVKSRNILKYVQHKFETTELIDHYRVILLIRDRPKLFCPGVNSQIQSRI